MVQAQAGALAFIVAEGFGVGRNADQLREIGRNPPASDAVCGIDGIDAAAAGRERLSDQAQTPAV
ncbi:hypothetical protein D3C87_1407920 [compost metagenome]